MVFLHLQKYSKLRSDNEEGLIGCLNISDDIIIYGANQDDHDKKLQAVFELTVLEVDGLEIILRGTRLVIPQTLQRHCVGLAYDGHLGIVKTKALLREKVWFPFIDTLVEERCKNCIPCLSVSPHNPPEPIKVGELPQ